MTMMHGTVSKSGPTRVVLAFMLAAALASSAGCARRLEPGTVDCDDLTGLCWVFLRGGEFTMGSGETRKDRPPIRVRMSDFELTRSEITVEQYGRCVRAGRCRLAPPADKELPRNCNLDRADRPHHPINCANWHMAKAYCAWAGGRLPSEAEWEYAARGMGLDRIYPWGDEPATCDRAHLSSGESGSSCEPKTTLPVCSRPAGNTPQGLCDMAGNVFEWTADWYTDGYEGHPRDGSARLEPETRFRSMRGGGIGSDEGCRVRNRVFHDPPFFYSGMGIRCARDRPPR